MFGLLTRRARQSSQDDEHESFKKPRRSERLTGSQRVDDDPKKTPIINQYNLPTPLTAARSDLTEEESSDLFKEATATPPEGRPSQVLHRCEETFSQTQGFSSPPDDTQPVPSQPIDPNKPLSDEVEDEVKEGV